MPHACESFLNVIEVLKEVTLVLQVFLNDDSALEGLFYCAPPSSESCLPFGQQLIGLTFQSI
ncbi:hypothetical protein DPMN_112351 [Dreissena polymorpha]|uniref:Uncharacterized protein n=1 Tax=Dreissena polymorpha TaxID=45954 RepID=A0A9D4QPU2_DREPO|nr:hypothetical protein DPMN_112351 [Dreissena polymorpha]